MLDNVLMKLELKIYEINRKHQKTHPPLVNEICDDILAEIQTARTVLMQ